MTDPEPYPDDYDLNVALQRVQDTTVNLVVYAQNAQNATGERKREWIRMLQAELARADTRMEDVESELSD
jgi:hypothetical protein